MKYASVPEKMTVVRPGKFPGGKTYGFKPTTADTCKHAHKTAVMAVSRHRMGK